ncbi:MAG TPA: hypothetical protein VF488_04540, partial [Gemmatimonadaceae bacterium]
MDVREQLRRYLEQRRDLGETELVLDSLSVEEALALLGAKHGVAQSGPRPERPRADDARGTATAANDMAPPDGDWRAAIRAAGGAPESGASSPRAERAEPMPRRPSTGKAEAPSASEAADAVHVPSTQNAGAGASPLEDVPAGLVVGGASRALFDDPAAKLDSLDAIARVVAECHRCPLYATAKNPVPGDGN